MDLSIVIVHYRVKEFLWLCLSSLQEACESISYEIIVVDNASEDESQAYIGSHFKNLRWIQNRENLGFSKGNNQGVAIAKGEYVLILNPDTILAKKSLLDLLSFAETKQDFGAIGLKMIDGAGLYLPESKRNIPTPMVALNKIIGRDSKYYAHHLPENEVGVIDVLPGAFMLLKKSVFACVGGFDEDYFMYGEDIDLCKRLLQKGYTNYYFGQGAIIHFKGESTRKDIAYYKNFYGALQIYFKKHYHRFNWMSLFNQFLVKSLIVLKTTGMRDDQKKIIKENILFFGEKTERSEKINSMLSPKQWAYLIDNEKYRTEFDTVIFDHDYLNSDQIIDLYQQENFLDLKKRILLKEKRAVLGSDDSNRPGEVLLVIN